VADARFLARPLPSRALVFDGLPCFLPDRRRLRERHLVVTPSLQVVLVCRS